MALGRELAGFTAGTAFEALPADAVIQAKRAILDTLGVALAGCREDAARIVAERADETGGAPQATVLGRPFRAPAAEAALINGTAAHALDFDDVNYSMRGHPSAPLLPAVLATAEVTGAGGADVILAFVLGVEVETKLGRVMGGRHYSLGWHPTSTLGSIGAAAACAKLRGLDAERALVALGIAASMAGGLRANFGTMTKPLHAGLAARNGVQAAELAACGFTAAGDSLESGDGFVAAFLGERPPGEPRLDPLGAPYDIVSPGIAQKLYPCCYATHRAVDAALELSPDIDAAAATSVAISVSRGTLTPLIERRPRTGLEGKFNLDYCVATALLDGAVRAASFADAAVLRPSILRLLDVTRVSEDQEPQANPLAAWAEVSIGMSDGSSRSVRVDVPKGDPRRPLTWDEITGKFRDCASAVLSSDDADAVIRLVARLEELEDIRALTGALAGRGSRVA
ncbi:MAG TPA: MmgE/PrpD family protein [Dehalococcoidia bacterium]|nr:MmgE/PrpD family protein [Dehalococcoidia bacterium]